MSERNYKNFEKGIVSSEKAFQNCAMDLFNLMKQIRGNFNKMEVQK